MVSLYNFWDPNFLSKLLPLNVRINFLGLKTHVPVIEVAEKTQMRSGKLVFISYLQKVSNASFLHCFQHQSGTGNAEHAETSMKLYQALFTLKWTAMERESLVLLCLIHSALSRSMVEMQF